ncbi:hypothetical protein L211DRAFT_142076 [Terfezia boudieri ATCC MYA-4762]|uniref:Uncharacterized protein n=1 Tax=Terfezia boudieri ATCC MYA-4762 TaxID=1051890 RepID=A0A3N4LTY0_9PEZI|nr:hypothetical protein L211DRAFT_142076 [Terfezia boudieri ATCC MYA-4762]
MASVPYIPTSDPTDGERAQLYRYHLANKFLNQQELVEASGRGIMYLVPHKPVLLHQKCSDGYYAVREVRL